MKKIDFRLKDQDASTIAISGDEIQEMIPDADMRYTLLLLENGDKHFVKGTQSEIQSRLAGSAK